MIAHPSYDFAKVPGYPESNNRFLSSVKLLHTSEFFKYGSHFRLLLMTAVSALVAPAGMNTLWSSWILKRSFISG